MASAAATISSVAAISKFKGLSISALSRAMSSSRICRLSSRKCAVMPSAPAAMASLAARTGSGWRPPRALRMVATWSTLTPRRSFLAIDALRLGHHRLRTELRENGREVLEVVDLEIDGHVGEVRGAALHADIVDIAVVLGDHLRDLRKRARLVDRLHRDAHGEAARRALVLVPAQVDPALGMVLVIRERRRLDRIDG